MEYEKFNEPYEILRGVEDGRLVEIAIRAVGEGAELTYDEIREATRQILDYYRRENLRTRGPVIRDVPQSVRAMVAAYNEGHGRVTDDYLARLAIAYEELLPRGRSVSLALASALDAKLPTVKGHIMRARREGFLTEALEGREGGEATAKSRKLVSKTED
ncbi:hypothetical protein MPRF_12350 [Mycolicibacterium parafortuitum]|uniref:Uncharacterized protein n=1 Tax=Mycolicibacterium parafortuitum TaxID=39692 RepID=A0A7I7U1S8_MYCPF|nr:hypothetical protein [Mycolicibacterium parafortuitum]BBY74336.1 hypothetical protein MPRF_12350 [Mycolicibacterium parafortuitum]